MIRGLRSFPLGAVLGVTFVLLVHSIPPQAAREAAALFLALTAGVYVGALLAQEVKAPIMTFELAVASIVFALAVVGLRTSTVPLALGYAVHGIWDLLHHPRVVTTRVAHWFPPLCSAFDFIVAIALLLGTWRPLA